MCAIVFDSTSPLTLPVWLFDNFISTWAINITVWAGRKWPMNHLLLAAPSSAALSITAPSGFSPATLITSPFQQTQSTFLLIRIHRRLSKLVKISNRVKLRYNWESTATLKFSSNIRNRNWSFQQCILLAVCASSPYPWHYISRLKLESDKNRSYQKEGKTELPLSYEPEKKIDANF